MPNDNDSQSEGALDRAAVPPGWLDYDERMLSPPASSVPVAGSTPITRVFITGTHGQLGAAMVRAFADVEVTAHTRSTLDVTGAAAVSHAVRSTLPQLIVNCAAFNDVDGAEERAAEALAVNAFAVRNLARAAEDVGARLVHYSTDFVFDGTAHTPYSENVRPSPRGTYAASKLLGEWFALEAPGSYVLRVESLFGSPANWTGRRSTLDAIVANLEQGREVRAFTDRIVSPAYLADIAQATRHLTLSNAAPGLYHCVNAGHATWYDVAREVATIIGNAQPNLVPVTIEQMKLKAQRPRYCALSIDKLSATGFTMPTWQDALRRWLAARGALTT
jgi:dTDP-4-dehydrorhamnose reductase